ncbi:MAG TPA: maleylpyruvate isomerase family mycothiol-dependent enzyme [Acidimicrobiales bacterium]|nr:maleylpyruvate isomerase family mycothiol-dependent enzyme [Acidimicrobiales bacterium]
MTTVSPSTYVEAVRAGSTALLAAARTDMSAAVPSCPGWTVADVVRHVASVHRWAATAVQTGGSERPDFPSPPAGLSDDALIDWAEVQAAMLLAALNETDPDASAWTFGPPRTARFWLRRQAHETSVHAWDAGNAVGSPLALSSDVAADGVAEYLEVMLSRLIGRDAGPWNGETIHFHRTDGEGEWLVTLGPAGAVAVEAAHGKGDLAVRAPGPELLLWITNRVGADRVELLGQTGLAEQWRSALAF